MILTSRVDLSRVRVVEGVPSGVTELLARHPSVATQPPAGRAISAMVAHNGVLLLGYGDWVANTGPVDVCGYDLVTGAPVVLLAGVPTEALGRIRILDGVAYAPKVDPKEGSTSSTSGGFATDEGGTWHVEAVGPMIHTFDVIKFKGDLYVCGSVAALSVANTGQAAVFRRRDGVWSMVLRGQAQHDDARFYSFSVATVDGAETLRVVESDANKATTRRWSSVNGADWSSSLISYSPADFLYFDAPTSLVVGGYRWTYSSETLLISRTTVG